MGLRDVFRALLGGKKPPAAAPPPQQPPKPRTQAIAPASPPASAPRPAATPPRRPQPRETVLNLDAGMFQPLSAEQVSAQARPSILSNLFQFGRRGRIPSVVDPRTKLIDQAMVGQGLITPEELVRIHELGEKYDELRPEQPLHWATSGARAVEADKQERERIKAEKKAAAEQKRREHAARVAHNKQTDIVHLGRGVSAGLADRRSNIERLQHRGLPPLSTPADVATALQITIPRLRWLAYHAEASTVSHYIQFVVPKKSGGERTLSAPHKQLATAQRWILENILNKLPAHAAAHGFVKQRSIVTNATPHVQSVVVINCDLTDFFPSINVHRVIGLFRELGYSPAVATILALLVTECPRRKVLYRGKPWHVATGPRALPQGACTSPAISNLVSRRLDARFTGIAKKLGFVYTRYADDLTFSSRESSRRIGYLLARVRHIAQDEGFAVNEKKTRVLKQAARQSVTGIVVNAKPSTPRRTRRQLRAMLHNAMKTGLPAQNRNRRPNFSAWVRGMIAFISMANAPQATRLKDQFQSLGQ